MPGPNKERFPVKPAHKKKLTAEEIGQMFGCMWVCVYIGIPLLFVMIITIASLAR